MKNSFLKDSRQNIIKIIKPSNFYDIFTQTFCISEKFKYSCESKVLLYFGNRRHNLAASGALFKVVKVKNYTVRCHACLILPESYSLDLI